MTASNGPPGTSTRQAYVVRFRDARLGSRRAPLVRGLDLTIEPGHVWCFLTQDGAAKTALLHVMLGIRSPSDGAAEWNAAFSSRSRISFVPQRCDLSPGISTTVREFVSLGLIGMPRTGIGDAERIRWALEHVGLEGSERTNIPDLARSERRRLLVARALARRPHFLVVDDPTEGLADAAALALFDVLSGLNRNERLTIAFFTTSVPLAERYATRLALVNDGMIQTARREDPSFHSIVDEAIDARCVS